MTLRSQMRDARPGPADGPVSTHGVVLEVVDARTCVAALPNGKRVHAHYPKRVQHAPELQAGDRIALELSHYDFSRARILPPSRD